MKLSHSRIETFYQCKYKYKLRYIDKLKTLPEFDPSSPLILGTTLHKIIQEGEEEAYKYYSDQYPLLKSKHYEEWEKVKCSAKKLKADFFSDDVKFEEKLETDDFIGFIDALDNGNIYDFKYSVKPDRYKDSIQLHLYKFFYQITTGKKIDDMYYIVFPKTMIRKRQTERPYEFKNRLKMTLDDMDLKFIKVDYDERRAIDYIEQAKEDIKGCKRFEKNKTKLCDWCEYQKYCFEGVDYMLLPENKKRNITEPTRRKMWFYGEPFSGKTYFANQFPNALILSTDGNYQQVDSPAIDLKDTTVKVGRLTKNVWAWQTLKDIIVTLEANENTFDTIIIDLIEDCYESCRLYMYDKLGITHESDDSLRAWDKVRTEFLSTIRRFFNLDYSNLIIISHEVEKKDIMKNNRDAVTAYRPNLSEKPALKLSGMVDVVARMAIDKGQYVIQFKPDERFFGGGRLNVNGLVIPSKMEDFEEIYKVAEPKTEEAKEMTKEKAKETEKKEAKEETEAKEVENEDTAEETEVTEETEKPKRKRGRRTRATKEQE